jgi:putative membrane protein
LKAADLKRPGGTGQKASLSDYLAAERTLLAWIRTGLASMGFGFVVARFGLFLERLQAVEPLSSTQSHGFSLWFGTMLIGIGVVVNVFSGWQHFRLVRALDAGEGSSSRSFLYAVVVSFVLAVIGLAMAIYLILLRHWFHL